MGSDEIVSYLHPCRSAASVLWRLNPFETEVICELRYRRQGYGRQLTSTNFQEARLEVIVLEKIEKEL